MPYTPPAAQSPVASKPHSPVLSRSASYHNEQLYKDAGSKHTSPYSAPRSPSSQSYLSKHRRSPSITKSASPASKTGLSTPDATPLNKSPENEDDNTNAPSQEKSHVPTFGRIDPAKEISPPVSPQTSSDDETTTKRGRSRDVANLAELQAAIQIIEQHRAGSPNRPQANNERKQARLTLGLPSPRIDISKTLNDPHLESSPRLPLSAGARKISHSRSTTDATAFFDFPRNKFDSPAQSSSQSDDEDVEDEELRLKPALIRKKSGELVRPALRASSAKRRPSSMPGTPTYSKAVHFQDNSLEHVRHFLQVDRPIAVSAGTSPVDPYDSETEYPFGGDGTLTPSTSCQWKIGLSNFPRSSVERRLSPVWTENVYLSEDTKVLIGSVVVRNLAFHKLVVARFTLDYWKTTSEVVAEYSTDVRKTELDVGYDRFTFNIRLEDQANLETKTMYFCIRYSVNGQDYWDNNNSINYQIDFSKTDNPQNARARDQAKSSRPANALSRNRPSNTFSPRPRSMPSFDDFAGMVSPYNFSSFPQPSALIGDSPIRFKTKPPPSEILSDAPVRPSESTSQQAFGNRYDFGASISAAIQAKSSTGVQRGGLPPKEATTNATDTAREDSSKVSRPSTSDIAKSMGEIPSHQIDLHAPPKPKALTSEKPSLSSNSYHELLDKYCFVRSGHNTTAKRLVS